MHGLLELLKMFTQMTPLMLLACVVMSAFSLAGFAIYAVWTMAKRK